LGRPPKSRSTASPGNFSSYDDTLPDHRRARQPLPLPLRPPDVGVPRNHEFRVREDAKNSAESFSKASRSSDDRRVPAIYRLQTEKPIIATSI
jgi:hypothetical protein